MRPSLAVGAYAPYADMLWCETSTPDLAEARKFAEAIPREVPWQAVAYNCSPSFNWKKKLDDVTIANFSARLGKMGYKFQFVILAGFHSLNMSMFPLGARYSQAGMNRVFQSCSRRVRGAGAWLSGGNATSASWALAISMRSRRLCPAAIRPRRL